MWKGEGMVEETEKWWMGEKESTNERRRERKEEGRAGSEGVNNLSV